MQRAYGYGYDPLSRLLQGDFVARAGGAASTSGAWTEELDNYRLSFASHDDNGNILSLRRRGLLANATRAAAKRFGPVDHLAYAYQGNRLQAVDDQVTGNQLPRPAGYEGAPASLAGDFQEGGTRLGQEYGYDANGNTTQDRNKGLRAIAYNHLNLPRQIHFGLGADSLVFRYTAAGQKVAKLVYQSGKPMQRTDYLGPYQYEQDSLRFFPHAEGRVLRFANPTSGAVRYEREYAFKDHLGNLRLAYRLGHHTTFAAGMEPEDAGRETQQFDSLSVSPPVAHYTGPAGANTARTGSYVARLNAGGPAPQPLGPLTQLAVQKGDTVTVTAPGHYPQAVPNSSFAFSLASFVASLVQPAPGAPAGPDGRRGGLPLLSVGVSAGLPALTQLGGGVPKGYVRLLVFDADSNLVSTQTRQLSPAAHAGYEALTVQVIAPTDGYVTAYVGNESAGDVYFDDVTVVHGQGLQIQENHYDPWGLSLAGLDYNSPGLTGLNRYQYNGKEKQHDLGLGLSDYGARMYDGQLGRWHSVDAMAAKFSSLTPYNYVGNHPTLMTDPDGRDFSISVTRDKNGEINGVKISSTVYIQGAGATTARAQELNEYAADNLTSKNIDGVTVSFDVKYRINGTGKDRKTKNNLGNGENLLTFNSTPEQSTKEPNDSRSEVKPGLSRSGQRYVVGRTGTVYGSGSNSRTVLHETMHLMGLSDRYDDVASWTGETSSVVHPCFDNNLMYNGQRLVDYQYQQYLIFGKQVPSIYKQDTAPNFDRYVDQKAGNSTPRTPFEEGGFHHVLNPQ